MKEVLDFYRKVRELGCPGCVAAYDDPASYAQLHPSKVAAIRNNPFLESETGCGQLLGICGSTIIGGICPIPLQIVADGKVYSAICGSSLLVIPEARSTGYGMDIPEKMRNLCKDRIDISCGISNDSRRLLKLLGRRLFPVQRHVMIRRSREFTSYRHPQIFWRIASIFFDAFFRIHLLFVRAIVAVKLRGLSIRQIEVSDDDAIESCARLVEEDRHRFRQNITPEWIKWVLTNEFRPIEKVHKRLYGVYSGNELVAFWISKTDSSGERGRVIEWQVSERYAELEPWIFLRAALMILPFCNAVNLDSDDEANCGLFSRLGFLSVPGQFCAVGADDNSRLREHTGYTEQRNWRVRMSMADAAFC